MSSNASVVAVAGLLVVASGCSKTDTSDQRSLFPDVADAIHEVVNEGLVIEAVPITEGVERPTLGGKIEDSWGTVTFRYALDEIPEDIFAKEKVSVVIDTQAEALLQARLGGERSFILAREKLHEHFSTPGYASMVDNEFLRVRATLKIDDWVGTGQVNVRIFPGEGYVPVSHTSANTCEDPFGPSVGCHAGTSVSCPALCESQGVPTGDPSCRMDCMWTTQGGNATRRTCTAAGGRCGPVMGGAIQWRTDYAGTIYRDWGGQCNDGFGPFDGCECDDTAQGNGNFLCQERGMGCTNETGSGCESACNEKTCGP